MEILTDVLKNNLIIVFCGMAVGSQSRERGAYYAGDGNKFWNTLYQLGLTDYVFNPKNYTKISDFGIGLTDLVKSQSGGDSHISHQEDDNKVLRKKILKYKPTVLAFNGKKAARLFFKEKQLEYGEQVSELIGSTRVFILPSTSGLASRYWNFSYWQQIGDEVIKLRSAR
jgi:TDG/mug DNA glycosylase family protein